MMVVGASRHCAVAYKNEAVREQAWRLAEQLRVPLVMPSATGYDFLLLYTPQRLELIACGGALSASKGVFVDFVAGRSRYRHQHGGGRREAVARACGLSASARLSIIDATAGFARDAFVLASLGSEITLIERNAIIGALLADGIRRARAAAKTSAIFAHVKLVLGDSIDYLSTLSATDYPDVVYLDPMYPPATAKNNAQVKKDQQFLQALIGAGDDTQALLNISMQRARKRVALKRPYWAPSLLPEGLETIHCTSLHSGNTRFDIYFPTGNHNT